MYEKSQTTPTATNSWTQTGNHYVTLRVTDNGGATSTKTITVSVSSGSVNGDIEDKGTPGFELIIVICAIALLLLWKQKRKLYFE